MTMHPTKKTGPDIVTFGCRLNIYESEVIREQAAEAGLEDAVVINTCAVTNEAVRQARQAIRRAKRERPDARIIVTGCAAQIDPAPFAAMEEVDLVLGNEEKLKAASYGAAATVRTQVGDWTGATAGTGAAAARFPGRVRAYVEIQNGCDHRCTFCIIPYGRGPSRSVAPGEVIERTRSLALSGYREIVLTGVDITAYGEDLDGAPRLGDLVGRMLREIPELERLRLTSLDTVEIDDRLLDLIATEQRLQPHIHLSLQAGDNMILKRMKRRHSRDQAIEFCRRLREARPDVSIGADLIAGFPTETEEMFTKSLDIVDECGLAFLHVFPFSPREGTPAARMPQMPKSVIKERASRLRAKGQEAKERYFAQQIGRVETILMEKPDLGRTGGFAQVTTTSPRTTGSMVRTQITGFDVNGLKGLVV